MWFINDLSGNTDLTMQNAGLQEKLARLTRTEYCRYGAKQPTWQTMWMSTWWQVKQDIGMHSTWLVSVPFCLSWLSRVKALTRCIRRLAEHDIPSQNVHPAESSQAKPYRDKSGTVHAYVMPACSMLYILQIRVGVKHFQWKADVFCVHTALFTLIVLGQTRFKEHLKARQN